MGGPVTRRYAAAMPCLFCGSAGPMSREHVMPRWLKKLFPDLEEVDYLRAFQRAGGALTERSRPGVPFDLTVRDFCERCNNGWMSRLEREAAPILSPMIGDQGSSLDAIEQYTVTVWAIKSLLAVGPTNLGGEMLVPTEAYRWFGDRQAPLPASVAWLGRYEGGEQWPISFHHHGMVIAREDAPMPPEGSPTNGFHSVFAIGHLALCVFQVDIPDGPMPSGGSGAKRVHIWPRAGDAVWWPPPDSFRSTDELQAESRLAPGGRAEPLTGSG
jgi:hypothetical protein